MVFDAAFWEAPKQNAAKLSDIPLGPVSGTAKPSSGGRKLLMASIGVGVLAAGAFYWTRASKQP